MLFYPSPKSFGKRKNMIRPENGIIKIIRMERSLALDANIGDSWAYYWKFVL